MSGRIFKDLVTDLRPMLDWHSVYVRTCKMCGYGGVFFATVDFSKSCGNTPIPFSNVAINYFRCIGCEFIFTDFFDEWLPSDFSRAIYNERYMEVDPEYDGRRARLVASDLLPVFLNAGANTSVLDYGSGSGFFSNALIEGGIRDAESYDPFSNPRKIERTYDIITSFEALEHSPAPLKTLDEMINLLSEGGCLYVGQTMQPPDIEEIKGNWWYIAPRNGHISFFSYKTIATYARNRGLSYKPSGNAFILYKGRPSEHVGRFIDCFHEQPRRHVLTAPGRDLTFQDWHGIESVNDRAFRWTKTNKVHLGEVIISPEGTFVEIPYIMGAAPQLAENCILHYGDRSAKLHTRNGCLCAMIQTEEPMACQLYLETAQLIRPSDDGGSNDNRRLGLAIPIDAQ